MECYGGWNETLNACVLHSQALQALWTLLGVLWLICLAFALEAVRIVRRSKSLQLWLEKRVLFVLGITSLLFAVLGFYKAANPIKHTIGNDLSTTLLFAFANTGLFTFLNFAPINSSGTGFAYYALQRKRDLYEFYLRFFIILELCTSTVSFVPLALLMHPNLDYVVIRIILSVLSFALFVILTVMICCLHSLKLYFEGAHLPKI